MKGNGKPTHIGQLTPDPKNRRKHNPKNIGMLVNALHSVGAARSIVIDERGEILAGNGVVEAAGEAGITKLHVVDADGDTVVAVRRQGLSDEQKRLLAMYDNRVAELAEWNWEQLGEDVKNGLDLKPFEFDEAQLAKAGVVKSGLTDPDAVPEELPTDIKLGDLFQLGEHRLLCGDSTKAEDVARVMGGEKAALCFTSPPYNLGASVGLRNGSFRGKRTAYTGTDADADGDRWAALMDGFTEHALSVSECVAVNVQMLSGNKRELVAWLGGLARHVVDVCVWVKSNPPPAMAERVATSAFEFVALLSGEDCPNRAIKTASFQRGTFSNVYQSAEGSNAHTGGQHGATFPVEFAQHYIGNLSTTASTVYEPFSGSGTTLIACEQLGRKCYAIEIEPKYCQVAIDRWEQFTGKTAEKIGGAVQ